MPRKLRFFFKQKIMKGKGSKWYYSMRCASHRLLPVYSRIIFPAVPYKKKKELCQRMHVFNLPLIRMERAEHKELRQNLALLFTCTIVYSGTNLLPLAGKINDSLNWSLSCTGQEVSINELNAQLFQRSST